MSCRGCSSHRLEEFNGEVAIHFPGLAGIDKPIVWVFPKLMACLECGVVEFAVPEVQREQLRNGGLAA